MSPHLAEHGRAPILILGWGNVARGDDALGPLALQAAEQLAARGQPRGYVECVTDFQLQIEYALDVVGRERVLFVDAARDGAEPFTATRVEGAWDPSYTTHELSPTALLKVCRDALGVEPPPAWLLGIRGYTWELGDEPTPAALANLDAALAWLNRWLADPFADPADLSAEPSAGPVAAAGSRSGGRALS